MIEPPQYARYRGDAAILRAIGRVLHEAAATTADLPPQLADAAVDAWARDECEVSALEETLEQRQARQDAATLALIGLAVENARRDGVAVTIQAGAVTEAVAAAGRG